MFRPTLAFIRRLNDLRPLLLAVLCIPLLWAIPHGEYLWTDIAEIGDRALVRSSFADLVAAIAGGVDGHYYRPTVFVLHSLNFAIFGDDPVAFRSTNLALHVTNVFLIYTLLRRIEIHATLALSVAALFAVHPLAATPIAWIGDRTDLIALAASLGFLLFVLSYLETRSILRLALGAGLLAVGLGAKETVAATLVVSGVYIAAVPPDRRRPLFIPFAVQVAIVGGWFLWRDHISTNDVHGAYTLGAADRGTLAAYVHFGYLRQLLAPHLLVVCDATTLPGARRLWIAAGFAAAALAAAAGLRAVRRNDRSMICGLAWSVAFLLPTCGIVPLKHVRADRYLYCALPGLLLVALSTLRALAVRMRAPVGARGRLLLLAGYYSYCVLALYARADRFASNESLWTYETERNSSCLEGYSYLARSALLEHRLDDALTFTARALAGPPGAIAFADRSTGLYHRGLILLERGDRDGAMAAFSQLIAHADRATIRAESAYELGVMHLETGNYREASADMDLALSLSPSEQSRSDIFLLSSYAHLKVGQIDASRRAFERFEGSGTAAVTPTRRRLAAEVRAALATR